MPIRQIEYVLFRLLRRAIVQAVHGRKLPPLIRGRERLWSIWLEPCTQQAHGDYMCKVAFGLAPLVGMDRQELAEAIVEHLPACPYVESVSVAGPGFINFYMRPGWIADLAKEYRLRLNKAS